MAGCKLWFGAHVEQITWKRNSAQIVVSNYCMIVENARDL
jgi:hypothetical protein